MFAEMVQLPRTAVELLAKQYLLDTDWRAWYQLYLDLERFVWAAESLLCFMESGPEALFTSDTVGCYVDSCNDSFANLDREFSALLQKLFGLMRRRRRWPDSIGAQADVVNHHCHPKSYWMMCCEHVCFAGRVSADATRLDRLVLRMHSAPANRMMERDIDEAQLYHACSIDISNVILRKEAAAAARSSLGEWVATSRLLRKILHERCDIRDLVP
jgi:hypothetical protein